MSQSELSFEEAKKLTITRIRRLADFIVPLQNARGVSGSSDIIELMKWEQALRMIEYKVYRSSSPFQCDREAKEVFRFGLNLVTLIPSLQKQLQGFWNLWHDAFKLWRQSPNQYQDFDWWNVEADLFHRLEETDAMAEEVVTSVVKDPKNLLVAHALLNAHVARTESIEYVINKILERAIQTFGLSDKYDTASLCSVKSKVPKGGDWRSDVRAIRDAVSHKRYNIISDQYDWTVTFSNTNGGYHFTQTYNRNEFIRFFDQHTLLYKIQLWILIVMELLALFSTYLCKD